MCKRIGIVLMVLLSLTAATLFAGGEQEKGSSDDVVTIEFWTQPFASPENLPAIKELTNKFMKENPGIKIVTTIPPSNQDYRIKLIQDVSSGNQPDVGFVDGSWLAEFDQMNALQPLDKWFTSEMQKEYFDFAIEGATINNQIKALWFHTGTSALYYRKDLLKEAGYDAPPSTWEEVIEMADKLTVDNNNDGIIDRYALGMPLNRDLVTAFLLGPLYWAYGGEFSRDNQVAFGTGKDKQAMLNMMNMLKTLVDTGTMPENLVSTDFVGAEANFLGDQYAMCILGAWQYASLRDNGGPDFIKNIGIATIPAPEGREPVACAGGWTLAMMTDDPVKQEAAWKWMNYFSSEEVQTVLTIEATQMTTLKKVYELPEAKADPTLGPFKEILLNGKTRDAVPFYNAMDDEYQVLLQTAVLGNEDYGKAIEKSAQRAKENAGLK
jgi:multiple sugar transport system substrate-binding protein